MRGKENSGKTNWEKEGILCIFTCSVTYFLTEGTGSSFFLHKQWLTDGRHSIHLRWLNVADPLFELIFYHNFFLSYCNHYTSFPAAVQIYQTHPHLRIISFYSVSWNCSFPIYLKELSFSLFNSLLKYHASGGRHLKSNI